MAASSAGPWWCFDSPYFLNYFSVIVFVFAIKKFKIHLCSTFGLNLVSPPGRLPGAASPFPQSSCLGKFFFVWALTATLKWNKISRRHPPRGPGGRPGDGGWPPAVPRKWPSVEVSLGRRARTPELSCPSGWRVWRAPASHPARATGQARLGGLGGSREGEAGPRPSGAQTQQAGRARPRD